MTCPEVQMTCHPLSANVVRSGNQLQKHPKEQAHSKASTRCRCLWWRPWCWCCPFPGKVLVRKIADQFVGKLEVSYSPQCHNVTMSYNVIQCQEMLRTFPNSLNSCGPSCIGHVSSSRLFFLRIFVPWQTGCS